jgi:hypothetical protein
VKAIFLALVTLTVAVTLFLGGMAFTAYVIAEPEPHRFANLDAPDLWTSKPVTIEPGKQNYERIDAIPALASLPASGDDRQLATAVGAESDDTAAQLPPGGSEPGVDGVQTGAIAPDAQAPEPAMDPAHAEWCFGRYRSYRVEDNSYQPYGGGARRECQSPWTPMEEDVQAAYVHDRSDANSGPDEVYPSAQDAVHADARMSGAQAAGASGAPVGAHEEWCHARYRSYRVSDNSYQPFDGGVRRVCSSPYG